MRKLFFISILAAGLIVSCGNPVNDEKISIDSAAKKGMSVSDPLVSKPHVAVQDSVFNGSFVDRYDNGVIYMKGDVLGGLRAGEWVTFYKSGKEWSRGFYTNGLRDGYGVSYWENGQKSSEGYYKNDKMIGNWKFWDEGGHVVEKDFGGK